jgi:YidC/Oxa1 family membrane protein insertase
MKAVLVSRLARGRFLLSTTINVRGMSIFDGKGSDNGSNSGENKEWSKWGEEAWGKAPKAPGAAENVDVGAVGAPDFGTMTQAATKAAQVVEGTGAPAAAAATEALAPLSSTNPGHVVMQLVEKIHIVADVPYWQAIILLTVALRWAVLPIAIKGMRDGAKMQILQPEMKAIQAEMQADPFATVKQKEYEERMKGLFAKHQVTPFSMLLGPLAQMPIFLSMFFGIRQMGDYYDGFAAGGDYWFTNLALADSSMILPVVNSVMFLSLIELGGEQGQTANQTDQQKLMKNVFRAMGVAMVPLTMHMPSGLFVYWCTSSVISILQNVTLKNEALRRALDIPKVPVAGGVHSTIHPGHGGGIQEAEIISESPTTMDVKGIQEDKSPFVKLYEENQRLMEENRRLIQEEAKRRGDRK